MVDPLITAPPSKMAYAMFKLIKQCMDSNSPQRRPQLAALPSSNTGGKKDIITTLKDVLAELDS